MFSLAFLLLLGLGVARGQEKCQEGKNNDMDPRSSMNETTGVGSYEENEWSITDGGMDENCLLRKSNVLQKKKTWIHGRLT